MVSIPKGPGGGENGNHGVMRREFQFGKLKKVLGLDGGDGCTTMGKYLMSLNCTLQNG